MQAQLPPSQQHLQHPAYRASPAQTQYATNGTDQQRPPSADYTNGHSNGGDMNNPYQYGGGYGQPPGYPPSQHPQQQQQQQQQQPPPPPPQHQHQQQHAQRPPYMQTQLPPLLPGQPAGMPGMNPYVRDESSAPPPTSSANSQPQAQYGGMAAPQPPPHIPYQPQQHPQGPPSSSSRAQTGEKKMSESKTREGYKYSLEVVQQPQRARMCGFGDKDRRPITPPPCIRLVIVHADTGEEVDLDNFPNDPSFFVLQVDLWAESADREANVVRASSNSPAVSISSATTTSYPPPQETPRHFDQPHAMMYVDQNGQMVRPNMPGYAVAAVGYPGVPQHMAYGGGMYYPQPIMQPQQNSNAMYTRNLIGSLTVNAAKLKDTENKDGYWFVLQDLSVRTEGFFRLRMSFIDISNMGGSGVSRGKAPVLAWTYSDKFQVYSAKKFPGVIESTPLSKKFAQQGIKIPIRKDNKNEGGDDDDGD